MKKFFRHKKGIFWGLSGAIIANIGIALAAFVFSVSSDSILLSVFFFFLPASVLIGIHADLLNKIIRLKNYMLLMVGFISMLFATFSSFYIESLLFDTSRLLSMLFMNFFAVIFGIVFQWLFVIPIQLWRHFKKQTKRQNSDFT